MKAKIRKRHEINLAVRVVGWQTYLAVKEVFEAAFKPHDGVYLEDTPRITLGATYHGNGDEWALKLYYEAFRGPVTAQCDNFRMFLRGAIAMQSHLYPRATLDVVI